MDGMTKDNQQKRQRAQAQYDRAVDDLLGLTQELARQQRAFSLLQRISPELAQQMGRSLFDQMIAAEGNRAAEEATREFPEYLQEVLRSTQRGKPQ
jgi:hypothetical protein